MFVKRQKRRPVTPSPAAVLLRALDRPWRQGSAADIAQNLACLLDWPIASLPIRSMPERPAQPAPREQPAAAAVGGLEGAPFWQIWLLHRDYLRRYSLRFLSGNIADAEDALSEAMLKALQAFSKTEIRNPRAWLLRLVHNACMDHHRSRHRQSELMHEIAGDDDGFGAVVTPRPDRSPEEALAGLQLLDDLQRALKALPPALAVPLLLYLDDQPDEEIAGELNVTKEVIRKRRQIAREWLRRYLAR